MAKHKFECPFPGCARSYDRVTRLQKHFSTHCRNQPNDRQLERITNPHRRREKTPSSHRTKKQRSSNLRRHYQLLASGRLTSHTPTTKHPVIDLRTPTLSPDTPTEIEFDNELQAQEHVEIDSKGEDGVEGNDNNDERHWERPSTPQYVQMKGDELPVTPTSLGSAKSDRYDISTDSPMTPSAGVSIGTTSSPSRKGPTWAVAPDEPAPALPSKSDVPHEQDQAYIVDHQETAPSTSTHDSSQLQVDIILDTDSDDLDELMGQQEGNEQCVTEDADDEDDDEIITADPVKVGPSGGERRQEEQGVSIETLLNTFVVQKSTQTKVNQGSPCPDADETEGHLRLPSRPAEFGFGLGSPFKRLSTAAPREDISRSPTASRKLQSPISVDPTSYLLDTKFSGPKNVLALVDRTETLTPAPSSPKGLRSSLAEISGGSMDSLDCLLRCASRALDPDYEKYREETPCPPPVIREDHDGIGKPTMCTKTPTLEVGLVRASKKEDIVVSNTMYLDKLSLAPVEEENDKDEADLTITIPDEMAISSTLGEAADAKFNEVAREYTDDPVVTSTIGPKPEDLPALTLGSTPNNWEERNGEERPTSRQALVGSPSAFPEDENLQIELLPALATIVGNGGNKMEIDKEDHHDQHRQLAPRLSVQYPVEEMLEIVAQHLTTCPALSQALAALMAIAHTRGGPVSSQDPTTEHGRSIGAL
ncbi:hypothetical protein IAT40_006764 [Kwoniella sp. CBS 6097]